MNNYVLNMNDTTMTETRDYILNQLTDMYKGNNKIEIKPFRNLTIMINDTKTGRNICKLIAESDSCGLYGITPKYVMQSDYRYFKEPTGRNYCNLFYTFESLIEEVTNFLKYKKLAK